MGLPLRWPCIKRKLSPSYWRFFEGIADYFSHHEVNLLDDGKFVITPKWQEDNTFKYPATLYRGNNAVL